MPKKIAVALSTIASLILIFLILFGATVFAMNDKDFVTKEYSRLYQLDTSAQDIRAIGIRSNELDGLSNAYFRLVDYMEGRVPDITVVVRVNGEKIYMFEDEQEISHMADVRTLYQGIRGACRGLAVTMAVLYIVAAALALKSAGHTWAKGYCFGVFIVLIPVLFIGTWAVLDFGNFWDFFHEALFWNEDWLFPATSRMIQMLPEAFFRDLVMRIVLYAGAVTAVLFILALIVIRASHRRAEKRYERELEAARQRKRRRRRERAAAERLVAEKTAQLAEREAEEQ